MKVLREHMNKEGFTLIELLIIVAIIGVLASIAIPTFANYRNNAYNSAAISDLKNASVAQEAYYLDNYTYSPDRADLEAPPYNLHISEGVNITVVSANIAGFQMTAVHPNSGRIYTLTGPGGHISH